MGAFGALAFHDCLKGVNPLPGLLGVGIVGGGELGYGRHESSSLWLCSVKQWFAGGLFESATHRELH